MKLEVKSPSRAFKFSRSSLAIDSRLTRSIALKASLFWRPGGLFSTGQTVLRRLQLEPSSSELELSELELADSEEEEEAECELFFFFFLDFLDFEGFFAVTLDSACISASWEGLDWLELGWEGKLTVGLETVVGLGLETAGIVEMLDTGKPG